MQVSTRLINKTHQQDSATNSEPLVNSHECFCDAGVKPLIHFSSAEVQKQAGRTIKVRPAELQLESCCYLLPRSRGSRTSRRASPNRLNENTRMPIAMPG